LTSRDSSSDDTTQGYPDQRHDSSKWVVLAVAAVATFIAPFLGSSVNIALPDIAKDFGTDAVLLGWITMSYFLVLGVLMLPVGRLADIYGRNRLFLYGTVVYTIASLLCAIAPSDIALIGFRVLQAIGSAMIFGTALAIVSSVFPPNERGAAFGIMAGVAYAGMAAGPFLGGLLTNTFGWRSIYLVNIPLGLTMVTLSFWKLKAERNDGSPKEQFDVRGAVLFGISLVAISYGLVQLPAIWGACLAAAGVVGMVVFVKWETIVSYPLLDLRLFRRNATFALSCSAALIHYGASAAILFLLSLYLQYIHDMTPQAAGLVLVALPSVQAILSPYTGGLSDRREPRVVASVGMALTALGLLLLVFLSSGTPLGYIVFCLVLLGVGFAFFASPNTNAIMGSADPRLYGVASGIVGTVRSLGQLLSMTLAVLVLAIFVGDVEIAPHNYPSLLTAIRVTFAICCALCIGGVFISLARGKLR
jgi:EmrB/QacA subfamily drug resistance transporter